MEAPNNLNWIANFIWGIADDVLRDLSGSPETAFDFDIRQVEARGLTACAEGVIENELPESFWTDPLMYQGVSDIIMGPADPIPVASEEYGIDFEAEVAIITDDVPMGVPADAALAHVKLIMLMNDVSLRNLIPAELAKGFGFFQGKPPSAFSPVAVTPAGHVTPVPPSPQ